MISASRCQRLLGKAVDAGVEELRGTTRHCSFKNAARQFKKKLKKTFWPDVYVFEGPVWDRKLQETVTEDLAIWLPLELLSMIWELGLPEIILSTERMDKQSKSHLDKLSLA